MSLHVKSKKCSTFAMIIKKSGKNVNYIGSKAKLLSFIHQTIHDYVGEDLSQKIFCDLFAGSGVVGYSFKDEVQFLISNDCEYYSYVLNRAFLQSGIIENRAFIIDSLNALPLQKGLIYTHYCLGSGSGRNYFSDTNAQKIDALRQGIENYRNDEMLYLFLLASLLVNVDKIANTASVYSAFLKKLKPLAKQSLTLEALPFEPCAKEHRVYCEEANHLIEKIEGDILYLDPPYNRRQYGANYHLLNTIALYDTFTPKGKTGVRKYESSSFCKEKTALGALEDIIAKAKFPYIFLSYNDEGLIPQKSLASMMRLYGRYESVKVPHKRFHAYTNTLQKKEINEYIHIIEKF